MDAFPLDGHIFCRSEHAREKLEGAALMQDARVIVNVHREPASSYKEMAAYRMSYKPE
jgi:hypothetical protein